MGAPSYGSAYPNGAYILSLIGGIFIVLGGLVTMALGAAFSFVPGLAALAIGLGAIGLILGIIIIVLALRLKNNPESAKSTGVLILVLSLISYIGGGGFFIGLLLGLIGGILALVWNPPAPLPGYGAPGFASTAPPPPAAGAAQRFCSRCGTANVGTATFCAKCGGPL